MNQSAMDKPGKPFEPAWWLPGPHLQTLWAARVRRPVRPHTRRERLELPDGDFVDLDWSGDGQGAIVVILHGLEGSLESRYAAGLLKALAQRGWRGVLMYFRGCSGVCNRLPRGYHSGDTGDMAYLFQTLRRREPATPLAAVGYSLGGNALLKYLGETGTAALPDAAIAVSVPFLLEQSARRLERGFSRIYQRHLIDSLKHKIRLKFETMPCPLDLPPLHRLKTFHAFDDAVTAPLHGFSGADDYYSRASSRQYLGGIRKPTLILHALDDPFMYPRSVPSEEELPEVVSLELSRHGGHVGFVSGTIPWRPRYWLEERIPAWLEDKLGAAPP